MRQITYAVRELKTALAKIYVFETAINSLIAFLSAYFILSILNLPKVLAVSITLAYIIIETGKKVTTNKILQAEATYPRMREKLRTAAEYAKVENPVVNELHQEVISELTKVEEAEFVDERKLLAKTCLAGLLCFLILLFAPVSISLKFIEPAIEKATNGTEINITFIPGEDKTPTISIGGKKGGAKVTSDKDILGAPKIAKLGDEELKLMLKPSGDKISLRDVKEVEARDFTEQYPDEVAAVTTATYEERIPKEQQEIVKNYFASIAQS
ncbi:hypothetical protein HY640_02395 [Candidatus Woesearchaeota archaeon]|nr:hypothetical protein [Candidatus Woesearchaeota archaeon]